MGTEAIITVRALDASGKLKFTWPTTLLRHEGDSLVLYGEWDRPLRSADSTVMSVTNRSIEFYDLKKPYVIGAILDRTWELREYYARIVRPPRYDPDRKELSLEMLGLDVQITPEYDYEIIAQEDEQRALSEGDHDRARLGLLDLLEEIERREGPFDSGFLRGFVEEARRSIS
jgi:protein associated with RNAse G/E